MVLLLQLYLFHVLGSFCDVCAYLHVYSNSFIYLSILSQFYVPFRSVQLL